MEEKRLYDFVDEHIDELMEMSDFIFDNPECDGNEYEAAKLLTKKLEDNGFSVERGLADLPTSFRAVYKNGEGGPNLGLLCEYDALEGVGHACGHHMQGPAIIGAALALKEQAGDIPFTITVYGTPAEETFGGKINMVNAGCFKELDVALMYHASQTTTTDVRCMANANFDLTFHGVKSHAATSPEQGRSAFDALLLTFNAIEFMREHVRDDSRMHYTVTNAGGPENVVPDIAQGVFALRSYDSAYLDEMCTRFRKIVEGASLMTETTYELSERPRFLGKIPVIKLNDLLMEKAKDLGAPRLRPPREKTGSTDFGNVMYEVPGSCIRVCITETETAPSHSKEYLDAGKGEKARTAVSIAAKVLAASCGEMLNKPEVLAEIKKEFAEKKAGQ